MAGSWRRWLRRRPGRPEGPEDSGPEPVALAVAPGEALGAVLDLEGGIRLFETGTGRVVRRFRGGGGRVALGERELASSEGTVWRLDGARAGELGGTGPIWATRGGFLQLGGEVRWWASGRVERVERGLAPGEQATLCEVPGGWAVVDGALGDAPVLLLREGWRVRRLLPGPGAPWTAAVLDGWLVAAAAGRLVAWRLDAPGEAPRAWSDPGGADVLAVAAAGDRLACLLGPPWRVEVRLDPFGPGVFHPIPRPAEPWQVAFRAGQAAVPIRDGVVRAGASGTGEVLLPSGRRGLPPVRTWPGARWLSGGRLVVGSWPPAVLSPAGRVLAIVGTR